MTQLILELSQLEVEPIESQEMGANILPQEQDGSLETLTAVEGKNNLLAILTLKGSLYNGDGRDCSCSCNIPSTNSCNCNGPR